MTETKQKKILNGIHRDIGQTTESIYAAKKAKDDEFYTNMFDIKKELSHWESKFAGKRVVCPCDWDISPDNNIIQLTIEFEDVATKENRFELKPTYKVKRAKYTIIKKNSLFTETEEDTFATSVEEWEEEIEVDNAEINTFLSSVTCNFVNELINIGRKVGIKSITASGYNPQTRKGIKFQDVDYSKYDICVTNPPFSLYGEFMKKMVDSKIDFILLAPFLNRVTPNVGLNLMLKNCYLGYGRQLTMYFNNPDKKSDYKTKSVEVDWITTFPDAQIEVNNAANPFFVDYEMYKDEYEEITGMTMKDETHPIRVNTKCTPYNYDGWMFASITILDRLQDDKFEWYGTNFKGYYNKENPEASPFAHKATDDMVRLPSTGKGFHGIVFRKKK